MAFPSIRSSIGTTSSGSSATPIISLPATVSAGDTLIVMMRAAVGGAIGWPDGTWIELFDASSDAADDQMAAAWKKADGTEGGTTITLSCTSSKYGAVAWAIQDAADPTVTPPELSTVATGTTPTQPNSTTVTPTGGSKDYLFGALVGMEGEATTPPTYPSGYTLGQIAGASGSGGAVETNVRVAGAWKQATAASDDPGDWTYAGVLDDWTAYSSAVHPVTSAPPFIMPAPKVVTHAAVVRSNYW